MNENTLRRLVTFFFRYLWIVFGSMLIISFLGMLVAFSYTVKNTANNQLQALSTDLEYRVATNYRLLASLQELPPIGDVAISAKDRAKILNSFAKFFGIWMIGVADPDGTIASTQLDNKTQIPKEYLTKVMESKLPTLTDVFPPVNLESLYQNPSLTPTLPDDLRFYQLMPVIRQGKVVSIIFTATLLSDLNRMVDNKNYSSNGYYTLLDKNKNIIVHPQTNVLFKNANQIIQREVSFFTSKLNLLDNLASNLKTDSYSWYNGSIYYTTTMPIPRTPWTLVHRVRLLQTFKATLIWFSLQTFLFGLAFALIVFSWRHYLQHAMAPVQNILKQVIDLNRIVSNKDSCSDEDAASLLSISRKGLVDELTDLPTRTLFRQMLNKELLQLDPLSLCALFYVDMDNLKKINDTFGHNYGDLALKAFGKNLKEISANKNSLCSRYGGDEFLLFVKDLDCAEEAIKIANILLERLSGTVTKDACSLSYHVSIGVALYPLHAKHIDMVIQLADIALYEAKQNGKGRYAMYTAPTSLT